MIVNKNCFCRDGTRKLCDSCQNSNSGTLTDSKIWEKCKLSKGAERRIALEHLHNRLAPIIFLCFVNKLELEDVQDLIQELFLKVMLNLDNDKRMPLGLQNVRKFLYGVAYNIYRNDTRKKKRRQQILREDLLAATHLFQHGVDDDYALVELGEIIDSLPHQHKEFLFLAAAGFKAKEIAEKLDIPVKQVYNKTSSARKALKKRL